MDKRYLKLLYYLTENSRIKTKDLARLLKTSQQACSYLIKQYEKKNIIRDYYALVDPVKLGFTNILVGFDIIGPDRKKDIESRLSKLSSVVFIEENDLGVDLLLEYSVFNMSSFNKLHTSILKEYKDSLIVKFMFPVIVKHIFNKKYLFKKPSTDIIICGDREISRLSKPEIEVLKAFGNDPKARLTGIASKISCSTTTVSRLKVGLEKRKIISGYSLVLDYSSLGILRHHILFSFQNEGVDFMEKFVEFSRQHPNIVQLIKLMGTYQVMITIEELKSRQVVQQIRSEFPTRDYIVLKSEKIIKDSGFAYEDLNYAMHIS